MKITLTKIITATFLCALAVAPLRAQTNVTVEKTTDHMVAATNNPIPAARAMKQDLAADTSGPLRIDAGNVHISTPNRMGGDSPFGETVTAIVAIIAGCSVPIAIVALVGLSFYFRLRRNKMMHETLRAMIDKGVPIPPELISKSDCGWGQRPRNDRRTGLVLIGLGAGLAMFSSHRVGFIILFMGAAFVIVSLLEKKNRNDGQPPTQ